VSNLYEKIADISKSKKTFALCTVVSVKGSAPRTTGAKMIVFEDGKIEGTIGGGEVEKKVIGDAIAVIKDKNAKLFRHDLLHHHNMCCGGTMEIFIEPVMKKNNLYIFGAGHTGIALARYAVDCGFEVFLIDDRKEYVDACQVAGVNKMNLSHEKALPVLPFDENVYICIMTYSHPKDRAILEYCVRKPHAYLGMIGSRRKVEITKKMFFEAGIGSKDELEGIDMPMGISIGAEGPEEIAVSVIGKLIEVKNKVLVR
jgi:xanthine dehydrogenase accessory factor